MRRSSLAQGNRPPMVRSSLMSDSADCFAATAAWPDGPGPRQHSQIRSHAELPLQKLDRNRRQLTGHRRLRNGQLAAKRAWLTCWIGRAQEWRIVYQFSSAAFLDRAGMANWLLNRLDGFFG